MPRLTEQQVVDLIRGGRNWGRWGTDDQKGALNLVTPEKRLAALGLARSGAMVSLSRPLPTEPGAGNPRPASQYLRVLERARDGGAALEYLGIEFHGLSCTHIDALCHTWDSEGMWQGRDPNHELEMTGSKFGGIDQWRDGILTRGILLDIPALRDVAYVDEANPVHGDELEAAAERQGVTVQPGDALVLYCGRDRWDETHAPYGSSPQRPGVHASCLGFLSKADCAVLAWDMMEAMPFEWNLPWTVHGAIHSFGLAIIDNCDVSRLAAQCRRDSRWEFAFFTAPLVIEGGTGSPANPIAML